MKKETNKEIKLVNINKVYENGVHAIFDFNLTVKDGEFVVFVGPSGCGKSTTLRMIAGLEKISYGTMSFDDRIMNSVSPRNRDIAMVFQNYALYPHISVYKNMAIGLKLRKVPADVIDQKIQEAAKFLQLENFLNRKPKDLSGGQRQRVALGRAMVRDARVLLMDEPLSNLDAKLRTAMRKKILELHEKFKKTTIYVTHDQIEAITMADRIVVMKDGFIEQVGTPKEIIENPASEFVAKFIGSQEINIYEAKLGTKNKVSLPAMDLELPKKFANIEFPKKIKVGIRPSDIYEEDSAVALTYPKAFFECKVVRLENQGESYVLDAQLKDGEVITITLKNPYSAANYKLGGTAKFFINMSKVLVFDAETGLNIEGPTNEDTANAIKVKNEKKYELIRRSELMKVQLESKSLSTKVKGSIAAGTQKAFKKMFSKKGKK